MVKPNIYFFYGPDTYRSLLQLKTWQDAFLAKYGKGSVREIKVSTEPTVLSQVLAGTSLFNPSVLTIVRNPFSSGDDKGSVDTDDLLKVIEYGVGAGQHLILWQGGNLDGRLNAVKKIKALGKDGKLELKEFESLAEDKALKFIATEFKKQGFQIEKPAAQALFNFTSTPAGGLDSWAAINAVNQLSHFAKGRDVITQKDVGELIPPQNNADVFWPMIQAFAQNNKAEFSKNLNTIIQAADSEFELLGILSQLFEQVKNMAVVLRLNREGYTLDEIDTLLDFKKGRARFVLRDAKAFSEQKLTELMDRLIATEASVKQGKTLLIPALSGLAAVIK